MLFLSNVAKSCKPCVGFYFFLSLLKLRMVLAINDAYLGIKFY